MRIRTVIVLVLVAAAAFVLLERPWRSDDSSGLNPPAMPSSAPSDIGIPLPRARERVTLKRFGTHVSPGNSPVSPERFAGYHTGTDFELLPGEDETKLSPRALCSGPVVRSGRVSGYGGIVMQRCTVTERRVTVLYGHLAPSSLPAVGTVLARGDAFGRLGRGYSIETDGERPHLHVGVVIGWRDDLRGYVASNNQLSGWLDPLQLLP